MDVLNPASCNSVGLAVYQFGGFNDFLLQRSQHGQPLRVDPGSNMKLTGMHILVRKILGSTSLSATDAPAAANTLPVLGSMTTAPPFLAPYSSNPS
jgi:hypothetical protein